MEINVLGGSGFVGGRFCELIPNTLKNDRNDYKVKTDNVVYFISTIDNYNIHTDPYLDIETNLTTLIKTLESCKGKGVTFNFISSWFVYGGDDDSPLTEISRCDPKGFYSITKRTAEQLLITYCETFDIKYRILRVGNVLGEQDKKVSSKKNVVQYMIGLLKKDEPITLYNGGNLVRDYIYVDDLVEAINLIISKGELNGTYNVSTGIPSILGDVIKLAAEKLNSNSKIVFIDPDSPVIGNYLDISKLKSLGFIPKYSINDIIERLII
jgi:nucleoside-diphosphate-sugar epimerase